MYFEIKVYLSVCLHIQYSCTEIPVHNCIRIRIIERSRLSPPGPGLGDPVFLLPHSGVRGHPVGTDSPFFDFMPLM